MPKLDGTQIAERLKGRLEELRQGKEVAARDLRALLTAGQEATMDAAWAWQHQALSTRLLHDRLVNGHSVVLGKDMFFEEQPCSDETLTSWQKLVSIYPEP